jgi:oxygen-independent coproporphyrinogen-3 oxidase
VSGLYIHVPFCESKCPYCAFASAPKRPGDEEKFLRAIEREISARRAGFDSLEGFETLYVGGGTPSVISVPAWRHVIEIIASSIKLARRAEVTVEANPGSLTDGHLELWRAWRVTRVSVGAQSFDDGELRFLGRVHDSAQAADAIESCLSAGFETSVDLMFGLPGQKLRDWAKTLKRALLPAPGHLSIYQLAIEDGVPFARKNLVLPDGYEQYRYAQWRLARAGYGQYEIASFARVRRESRHNLNYWDDGDYVGIGPSAWSNMDGRRSKNAPLLDVYSDMICSSGSAVVYEERLDPGPAARQAAVLALRTRRGIDWRSFADKHGKVFSDEVKKKLEKFPANLVVTDAKSTALTQAGFRVANKVWEDII